MMKQRQKNKYVQPYKRPDKESKGSSDSGEETELFVRSKPVRKEIPSIEKVVEDGDTLQSLAIRYHCAISDLKRLNNIDKENEIFAKRIIKVPHRPFTMALAGVHTSGNSSPDAKNAPSTSNLIDIDSLSTKLDTYSNVQSEKKNGVNEVIFNSSITQKLSKRLTDSEVNENDFEEISEEVRLLPHRNQELPIADPIVSRLNWSGADCDIHWVALLVCIVIVIFAFPLIYVFYIAEHLDKYQHHNS